MEKSYLSGCGDWGVCKLQEASVSTNTDGIVLDEFFLPSFISSLLGAEWMGGNLGREVD